VDINLHLGLYPVERVQYGHDSSQPPIIFIVLWVSLLYQFRESSGEHFKADI
jgi:hypothetical protein